MDSLAIVANYVSRVGDPFVLGAVGAVWGVWLVFRNKWKLAAAMLFSIGLTGAASVWMKAYFMRARPAEALGKVWDWSPSFPSAHAAMAVALFVVLAYIVTRRRMSSVARLGIWSGCVGAALLVGWSRLILNVHWPSDVIAGWLLGAVCAAAAILLAERASRHPLRHVYRKKTEHRRR